MTWSNYQQVMPVVVFLIFTLVSIVSFRRSDRRHGQLAAYLGSGLLLMQLNWLIPSTPSWVPIVGALLVLFGEVIYFGRFHSLIDWRRYPKPGGEPNPE